MTLFAIFSPGPMEIIIVLSVFILLFGAKQVPKMMRSLGGAIPSFQRGMAEAKAEIAELERAGKEIQGQADRAVKDVADAVTGNVLREPLPSERRD